MADDNVKIMLVWPGSGRVKHLPAALDGAIKAAGFNNQQFAAAVGIDAGLLSHLRHGRRHYIDLTMLRKMADVLGVDPLTLIEAAPPLPILPPVTTTGDDQ